MNINIIEQILVKDQEKQEKFKLKMQEACSKRFDSNDIPHQRIKDVMDKINEPG